MVDFHGVKSRLWSVASLRLGLRPVCSAGAERLRVRRFVMSQDFKTATEGSKTARRARQAAGRKDFHSSVSKFPYFTCYIIFAKAM